MKIDLTCPVELWHFKMPTAEDPYCRLQLYNLTIKDVASIQATFLCYDAQGEQLMRCVERVQGLDGLSKHSFEMAVAIEDGDKAADMELMIEKVWFLDGTVWRRGTAEASSFTPNALSDPKRLAVLRQMAGRDAVGYPSDQGAVWVCVCGRPNAASEDACRRCRRDKHDSFTRFHEAAVEKVIIERENEMEEKARREREQAARDQKAREEKAARRKRRRRRIIRISVTVITLSALFYGVYFHGIPYYKYYTATRQLDNSQYELARAGFVNLADYRDSQTMVTECDYRKADANLSAGTFTSLKLAQEAFDALGNYRDSATRASEARYISAEKYLTNAQYEQAIAIYQAIPAYKDASAKMLRARYLWAQDEFENLLFDSARERFLALGAYLDSAEMAVKCIYRPATLRMDEGAYIEAGDLFIQAGEYSDAPLRAQEAYYKAGETLFDEQEYEQAAEYFLLSGDYLDAYRRATQCLYAPAVALMDEGLYEEAKQRFDMISGFDDSRERSMECSYQLGLAQAAQGNYQAAIAHFDQAIEMATANEARKEAIYQLALEYQNAGDTENALAQWQQIAEYKDAQDYINRIRYASAQTLFNAGQYEQALEVFTALGAYMDSSVLAQESRYGYAVGLYNQGLYDDALEAFTPIGKLDDASHYIDLCRYQQGLALMAKGSYKEAAEVMDKLSARLDEAVTQYEECIYRQGVEAMNAGNSVEASGLLRQVSGYKDAEDLFHQVTYQAAQTARANGELSQAAALFARLGAYQDAAKQATDCYDEYFESAFATAKACIDRNEYQKAVDAMEGLDMTNLSDKYAALPGMYDAARYALANALYVDEKPYKALVYYKQIPNYRDVAEKLSSRVCYTMLGKWKSSKNVEFVFKEDGTCVIDGTKYYFYARQYSLKTGTSEDNLKQTYQIVDERKNSLTLKNLKTKTTYKLTRVE